MFKVLLIVYILGGGGSNDVKNTYNTNFVFQEFHSMADCKVAVTEMKNILDGATDEEKDMIDVLYSTKCVEMSATNSSYRPPTDPVIVTPPLPDIEPGTRRSQSRWND